MSVPISAPKIVLALHRIRDEIALIDSPAPKPLTMSSPAKYRITVCGALSPEWSGRLGGMNISTRISENGDTEAILTGYLADQAALSSVLNTLYELHLPVASIETPCR